MKLAEMAIGTSKSHDFSSLCEDYYENYYDLVEKKCHKVFSNRSYVDKEDIMNEVIYHSVAEHQEIVKYNKNKGLKVSKEYIYRKSIEQGIYIFIQEDSLNKNTPHFEFGSNRNGTWRNLSAKTVVIDEPVPGMSRDYCWKDIIPDQDLGNPLDKLIYEEYMDILISLVEQFESSEEFSSFRKKSSRGRSKKRKDVSYLEITKMLLSEATPKDIRLKLGVLDACIHKTKRNVLLPLALIVIDDPLWYRKYWNVLSKKAKEIIYFKKGVAF